MTLVAKFACQGSILLLSYVMNVMNMGNVMIKCCHTALSYSKFQFERPDSYTDRVTNFT